MTTTTTTQLRKVTPTGLLVMSASAPRHDWLQARRHGIAATDLVAIMGLTKYKTAFDVWTDKVMEPDFDATVSEAGLWGTRLEDPVAREWADRNNVNIRRIGLIAHNETPWAIASLDRLVTGCPDGRCALEVKTRHLFAGEEWELGVPDDVLAQVRWQLLVSGLDHIHVAALIGGQKLIDHVVQRDSDHESKLLGAASLVWDAVQNNTPPNLPAELWTQAFLEQRHTERVGSVEVDADVYLLVEDYQRVNETIKRFTETRDQIRTRLIGVLGDAEVATHDGETLYTYTASTSRRVDSKALKSKYPDITNDASVWTQTTTRTLRVK